MSQEGDASRVVVMRCSSCGDTFPTHEDDITSCPSCGGEDLTPAAEPLL